VDAKFFDQQVLPILKANCFSCHGGEPKIKGGLNLTTRAGLLAGGDSGPAFDAADPKASRLLTAIRYEGEYDMPPKGKLAGSQIATLTHWVVGGAPYAEQAKPAHGSPEAIADARQNFWAFKPVARPTVPAGATNPIDAFIAAQRTAAGLTPTTPASKATLIRRAYYDLLGLPPTPEAVAAFVADTAPNAYEQLIDRLLASPHYGERWGRHWLDLVRYAETNSYERDGAKPFVWRYRDYVIQSFNADKPYPQFIAEQLAGDEHEQPTAEQLIATGYYRLGIWDDEPVDPKQAFYDDVDDIIATTGQVFLGLTINCARCHDHKLDPLPQRDYYRMMAFFQNFRRYGVRGEDSVFSASVREINAPTTRDDERRHERAKQQHEQQIRSLTKKIVAIEMIAMKDFAEVEKQDFAAEMNRIPLLKKRVPKIISQAQFDDYVNLSRDRKTLQEHPPALLAQALVVKESGRQAPPTHILARGNPHAPAAAVTPGFPLMLTTKTDAVIPTLPAKVPSTGRRTALAAWIGSDQNPLTARVWMNRIWQHHFGKGIVKSANNFGLQGTPPTHPALLDWLASELVSNGWRIKPMHRLIMLSQTYQLGARAVPASLAKDPENDGYWRFDMRRLDAEEIRDSILAVNGSLNRAQFGPSVYPHIPDEVKAGQSRPGEGWGKSTPAEQARRSIYVHVKRSLALPMLASFDAADTDFSCPVRFATTQPTQALGMLNSKFLNEQAQIFAELTRKEVGHDHEPQVQFVLERAWQRPPTPAEVNRGVQYLVGTRNHGADGAEALRRLCLLALNTNEFVYLD
jgi:mono/diheme cytochrome c family protein